MLRWRLLQPNVDPDGPSCLLDDGPCSVETITSQSCFRISWISGVADKQIQSTDTALEKLEKILPAQATATLLAIKAFLDVSVVGNPQSQEFAGYIILSVIVLIALLVPLTARVLSNVSSKPQQYIMALTFFIWAINIEYTRILSMSALSSVSLLVGILIPIVLLLWAILIVPILFGIFKNP